MAFLVLAMSALLALAQDSPAQAILTAPTFVTTLPNLHDGLQDALNTAPASSGSSLLSSEPICICDTCHPVFANLCCDCNGKVLVTPRNNTANALLKTVTRPTNLTQAPARDRISITAGTATNHTTKLYANINTRVYSNFITPGLADSLGLAIFKPSVPETYQMVPLFAPETNLETIFDPGWHAVGQTRMTLNISSIGAVFDDVPFTVINNESERGIVQALILGTMTLNEMNALRLNPTLVAAFTANDANPPSASLTHNEL